MSILVTILLVAIPLALGVFTIHINEQLRELKKHNSPDKIDFLTFNLSPSKDSKL